MNKIYSSLSLILLLLTLGSCDSMFDNEIPPHDLVGDNAITSESSAKVALNGVYSYLEGWGTWSAYYICDNEFRTGLLDPTAFYRSKTEGEQLPRLQVLDDNSDAENPWKSGYKIVNSANNFIYYTDRLPESVFGPNRKTEMLAEALLEKITPLELEILSIERKKAMEHPPKLFDLTLLQVECNRKFAYTAENTLKIIQSLYEKKLTTYPRVDTNFLPNDQYAKVPKILQGLKPYEALTQPILSGGKIRKSAKVFNDKKITDHHAIIPTGVFSYDMSPEEKRVYDLVARRFIAVFYPDCEIANTTVMARIGDEDFKATGKQIIDPAWRVVFGNNTDKQNEENVLPVYEKGEHGPHTPEIQEKQTQPPKYYTEADLLRAMETAGKQVEDEELRDLMKENGIGRPSTRANIIETLFKRQYIRKDKKRILATTTGIELIDTIQNDLLKSAELTGQWEKKLRMIEDGTYQVADFMEELKAMVNEIVHFVRYSSAKTITVETPEEKDGEDKKTKKEREKGKGKKENGEKIAVVLKCPKCGQGEIVKGKTAWGCTLYRKSCDFLIPMEIQGKKLTQKQVDTLIQKGQTGKISGFKDPEGNSFNGMIRLDENKNIIVDKI